MICSANANVMMGHLFGARLVAVLVISQLTHAERNVNVNNLLAISMHLQAIYRLAFMGPQLSCSHHQVHNN